MVRVKVIGLAFRVTVRGGYPGWGEMFYIHTAIGAKQLLGGISDWDWVCGGLGCHGSAGLCKLGGSL